MFGIHRDTLDSFPQLFKELEERSKELGVESYGISLTTLEEVNPLRGFLVLIHSLIRQITGLPSYSARRSRGTARDQCRDGRFSSREKIRAGGRGTYLREGEGEGAKQ